MFFTAVKTRVPNNRYGYPDVVVTCEEDADEYMIQVPCAVFEVLSESTEDVKVGDKLEEYLKISSDRCCSKIVRWSCSMSEMAQNGGFPCSRRLDRSTCRASA